MTKYMVIYNSPVSAGEQLANATPEETKAGMDAWMSWAAEAGDALVDLGMPLQARRQVTADGESDSSSEAGGYSIIEGADTEAISTLLAKHPHLQMPGTSIDILEVLPMPGM